MILRLALVLALLRYVRSAADMCDADPRVHVTTRRCKSPHLHLTLRSLDRNPFHALHDTLWAASHYLIQCVRQDGRMPKLTISLTDDDPPAHSACTERNDNETAVRSPKWGVCAAAALARTHGATLLKANDKENAPKDACYSKSVFLGRLSDPPEEGFGELFPHFRKLSYFGRGCVPAKQKRLGCAEGSPSTGGVVEIPQQMTTAAFRNIRESILRFVGVDPPNEKGGLVRVLLYSRKDSVRRQWQNANDLLQRIKNDKRLNVSYLEKTPRSFRDQVNLYLWADVVVAPHGAAMVNTIFMKPGSDVIEMWKYCHEDVVKDSLLPHHWTGWHGGLLGISVQYVQCHDARNDFKRRDQLHSMSEEITDGAHKVRVEDVLRVLDTVLERQKIRLHIAHT